MTKVKLTSSRCGHKYDKAGRFIGVFSQAVGDVVEMDDAEAQRHLDRGLAVAVPSDTKNRS